MRRRDVREKRGEESDVSRDDKVIIWGTGAPYREFLHVDDLADACLFLMNLPEEIFSSLLTLNSSPALINIGTGEEVTIRDLAQLVKEVVGFSGELAFDTSKPDGTPRKLCDVSRLHSLGWRHKIGLQEGLREVYKWFLNNMNARTDRKIS